MIPEAMNIYKNAKSLLSLFYKLGWVTVRVGPQIMEEEKCGLHSMWS